MMISIHQQCNQFQVKYHLSGGVLLEVLMALALILGAASVITGGLQSSVDSVERMKANLHGVNLAVSVISQIQMGVIAAESVEGTQFEEPFQDWSYDIETEEVSTEVMDLEGNGLELPQLQKVEVAIHDPDGKIVKRLSQYILYKENEDTSLVE